MKLLLFIFCVGMLCVSLGGIGKYIGVLVITSAVAFAVSPTLTIEWFKDEIKLWRKPR